MCALCSLAGIAPGGLNCVDVSGDPAFGSGDSSVAISTNAAIGAPPVFSLAQIVQQLRTQWGGSFEGTTASWPGTGAIPYFIGGTPYPSGSGEIAYKTTMTALMISRATLAFELWDDLIARDLNPVSTAASAQIQFEYATRTYNGSGVLSTNGGTYSSGWFNGTSSNIYGTTNYNLSRDEIWLNSNWTSHDQDSDMYFGGYGFQTYMHEIGHSLGLSHPGTYDASNGGSITYANNAEYAQDNRQYTVMSYFGGYLPNVGWQQDGTYSNWLYSSTPMLHDIAAIQAIYGADMTTRTGDTVYGFNVSAGVPDVFNFAINTSPIVTVWDAGGNDTIDLSGYSANQRVDLHAGTYSDVGGMFNNFAIAFNVTIENVYGGSGNDTLIGNDADNLLRGGPGNDTIDGGAGIDTAWFTGNRSAYTLTGLGGTSVRVFGPDGIDTLTNIEFLRFSDQTIPWPLTPDLTAALTLSGSIASVTTINNGGPANASVTGVYLSTDSTITTADTVLATFAVPAIGSLSSTTATLALVFPGNLTPGTYFIGAIADINGQVAESNEANNVANVIAVILGNSIANTLNGTAGGDIIFGLGGNDRLNGGAGADVLTGGTGADIFIFDAIALANATAGVFDRVTDYDQSGGAFNAAEGDQIDLSGSLSAAYNHGSGQPVSSLVRVVANGAGTKLQVDTDGAANGTNWVTIAQLDGLHFGDPLNIIVDASQPAGVGIAVTAPATPGDFDADQHADIFWRTNSGALAAWEMNGTQIKSADFFRIGSAMVGTPGTDWHLVENGTLPSDFDGDGRGDVLWRTDSGLLAIWQMNGTQIKSADFVRSGSAMVGAPGPDWHIVIAADFDGDERADLLWRTDSGVLAIWKMDGNHIVSADYLRSGSTIVATPGADWHVIGVEDFDGDGKGDLLWKTDDGTLAIWKMDGTQIKGADYLRSGSAIVRTPGSDWHIVGTGDFDGDGKGDLLWRTNSGALAIWEMDGTQIKNADFLRVGSTMVGAPGSDWHIHAIGDYDGDGRDDILWRTDSGLLAIWKMNGFQIGPADYTRIGSNAVGAPGSDWNIVQHHFDLI